MSNFKKESISVVLAQFTGYDSMVHEKSFMNIIDGIFVGFFSHIRNVLPFLETE